MALQSTGMDRDKPPALVSGNLFGTSILIPTYTPQLNFRETSSAFDLFLTKPAAVHTEQSVRSLPLSESFSGLFAMPLLTSASPNCSRQSTKANCTGAFARIKIPKVQLLSTVYSDLRWFEIWEGINFAVFGERLDGIDMDQPWPSMANYTWCDAVWARSQLDERRAHFKVWAGQVL